MTTIDGVESFALQPRRGLPGDETICPRLRRRPGRRPAGLAVRKARWRRPARRSLSGAWPPASIWRSATSPSMPGKTATKAGILAFVLSVEGKTGNGVHLYDPETGVLRVLDSSSSIYSGLSLAQGRCRPGRFPGENRRKERRPDPGRLDLDGNRPAKEKALDLRSDGGRPFPAGQRTVDFRRLSWSKPGDVLFFGHREMGGKSGSGGGEGRRRPAFGRRGRGLDRRSLARQRRLRHALAEDPGRIRPPAQHAGRFPPPEREARSARPGSSQRRGDADSRRESSPSRPNGRRTPSTGRSAGRTPTSTSSMSRPGSGRRSARPSTTPISRRAPSGKYLLFIQDDHYWTVDPATRARS